MAKHQLYILCKNQLYKVKLMNIVQYFNDEYYVFYNNIMFNTWSYQELINMFTIKRSYICNGLTVGPIPQTAALTTTFHMDWVQLV